MRILFFGTSEFAVPALEALIAAGMAPAAVVTLPDRPRGRGLCPTPSPVKTIAEKRGIPVIQPEKISDSAFIARLSAAPWDVGIVAAYGKLIPKSIMTLPAKGFLNIHPSLLPELRGPAPIQYAILQGKKETGVSVMLIDDEMDHGPLLAKQREPIYPVDTAETLARRLAEKGAELLVPTLRGWLSGSFTAAPQDHARATYSKKITKEDGHIDWSKPAVAIERMIRAFTPWPGAFSFLSSGTPERTRVTILQAIPAPSSRVSLSPGCITREGHDMIVRCGDGSFLRILRIRQEGRKTVSADAFLHGRPNAIGDIFS